MTMLFLKAVLAGVRDDDSRGGATMRKILGWISFWPPLTLLKLSQHPLGFQALKML